ncbi:MULTISPECIES: hypothetical protein [unclassified Microcoleus]
MTYIYITTDVVVCGKKFGELFAALNLVWDLVAKVGKSRSNPLTFCKF